MEWCLPCLALVFLSLFFRFWVFSWVWFPGSVLRLGFTVEEGFFFISWGRAKGRVVFVTDLKERV